MSETTIVKSSAEFPNWKSPCPKCGAKYPQPAISHRKDGTAAYCKGCGHNWKIVQTPDGWQQTGEHLGARTSPEPAQRPQTQPNGWEVVVKRLTALEAKVDELITEIRNTMIG